MVSPVVILSEVEVDDGINSAEPWRESHQPMKSNIRSNLILMTLLFSKHPSTPLRVTHIFYMLIG